MESLGFRNITGTQTFKLKLNKDIYTIDFQDWKYVLIYNWNDDEISSTGFSYIVDAIKYIFNYADATGKPAVINISLGI